MTYDGYLIWIIVTALMIITVLTVGTLAAAGMLPQRKERERPDATTATSPCRATSGRHTAH